MNILLIHLSDTHFGLECDYPTEKIKRIPRTIPSDSAYDLIALIVSGDLANSSKIEEYTLVQAMLDSIATDLEKCCSALQILFVPGNHDMHLSENSVNSETGSARVLNPSAGAYFEELELMDNFFTIANEYNLFQSEFSHHVEICPSESQYSVRFVLLNSAPFSTRGTQNKQLHYIPSEAIAAIAKPEDTNLNIVVMHHSTEWFEEESKRRIEQSLYENCDLFLVGHEHDGFSEEHTNSNNQHIKLSRGGCFSASFYDESTFSLISIDTDQQIIDEKFYSWNKQHSQYIEYNNNSEQRYTTKSPWQAFPSQDFLDDFRSFSEYTEVPLKDYFVFPELRIDMQIENEDFQLVDSENEFFELLAVRPCVSILGAKSAGKTSLLKMMYIASIDYGYSPLFLGKDNDRRSYKHLFMDLVREQYGNSDIHQSRFIQVPNEKKVLFIDDFDMIKKSLSDDILIKEILNDVGHVVFTSCHDFNTNIIEAVKRELGSNTAMMIYRIKDFFKERRDLLVERICHSLGVPPSETQEIITIIDRAVHGHIELFSLNPLFIFQNTQYYAKSGTSDRNETTPFSVIFEANLTRQIDSVLAQAHYGRTRHGAVSEALVLLGEMAYEMHRNKSDTINSETLAKVVNQYASDYDLEIETGRLVDLLREADIICMDKTLLEYRFASDTVHAYFVAKKIELLYANHVDVTTDINYLLNNVCFSINENILLFLSYLLKQQTFADSLLRFAEEALSPYESFSVESKNISFLLGVGQAEVKLVDDAMRKSANKQASIREEAISTTHKNERLEYRGIYEYNEDESLSNENRIMRSIKYLEMAGKALIAHYVTIPKKNKAEIVQKLYELPNKILYSMFIDLDKEFDEIISALLKVLQEDDSVSETTEIQLRDLFFRVGLVTCLGLYDHLAFYCANAETIDLLKRWESEETTHRIQRLIMMENALTTEEFINVAIKQLEDARRRNNKHEVLSIRIIVNAHIMHNPGISSRLIQRVSEKVFSSKSPKELLQKNREAKAKT